MSRVYVITLPDELDALIRQAMREEGIKPNRENIHRWMIGALTFTAAACTNAGYQAICDAYGAIDAATKPTTETPAPRPPNRKYPPSD